MNAMISEAASAQPRQPRRAARVRRFIKHALAALALTGPATFLAVIVNPVPAFAYYGPSAAAYADYYWNKRNTNYYTGLSNDCTNFVSQALHDPYGGGGFDYVGTRQTYDVNDDTQWWMNYSAGHGHNGFTWTYSWVRVQDLLTFLLAHVPGGVWIGQAWGGSQAQYTPNSVVTGDLLFYDWDSKYPYDHVAIQTGYGPTDDGFNGNYVDQHTTDRRHAFWTLQSHNSQWATTTILFIHIDPNNP